MAKMDPQRLIDALRDADYMVRSYSGYGMHGKRCVGVSTDSPSDLYQMGCALSLELGCDEAATLRPSTDSMGRGVIIYFPDIEWVGGEPDDEDEEG